MLFRDIECAMVLEFLEILGLVYAYRLCLYLHHHFRQSLSLYQWKWTVWQTEGVQNPF